MHNIIDLGVVVLILYYLGRGWTKGFVGSLIGPISLFLGAGISYMYFQQTHNIMISGIISFFGPILIHITLSVVTNVSTYGTGKKPDPLLISSLFGSLFSVAWGGGILVVLMLMVMVLPPQLPSVGKFQERLALTKSYQLVNTVTGNFSLYSSMPVQTFMNIMENPEQMAALQSSEEYQNFINDDRIKSLFHDPEMQQYVKDKNIAKMLADKRMIDILQDEDLLSKIFTVQRLIIEQGTSPDGFIPQRTMAPGPAPEKAPSKKAPSQKKRSGPLVIEIE
ncbi:MAG: hypothetical protein K8I00_11470 [Candidatus Omnitrophica bacterium]|nr:hypothetical protein [Candidatus Omnitrophota bacterium]